MTKKSGISSFAEQKKEEQKKEFLLSMRRDYVDNLLTLMEKRFNDHNKLLIKFRSNYNTIVENIKKNYDTEMLLNASTAKRIEQIVLLSQGLHDMLTLMEKAEKAGMSVLDHLQNSNKIHQ